MLLFDQLRTGADESRLFATLMGLLHAEKRRGRRLRHGGVFPLVGSLRSFFFTQREGEEEIRYAHGGYCTEENGGRGVARRRFAALMGVIAQRGMEEGELHGGDSLRSWGLLHR
ncbi:MAG: hypothetical protein K9G46_00900, partial [Flavobacteriales bacterium]|nr:hypothetical protein [Flavobacteriales bacterium]